MGKSIISFMLVPMFAGCQYLSWFPDDNRLEEYVEDVIYEETGVQVDFSGDSPE